MSSKKCITLMVEHTRHDYIVITRNDEDYSQKRVDPKRFASDNHNAFHSAKDCKDALLRLVGGNDVDFDVIMTPEATKMISKIYRDSIKLS